jgi:autotransporter-associated beta strand protein
MHTPCTSRGRLVLATGIAAILGLATTARAQQSFWDPTGDGDGAIGGSGVWNLTSLQWDPTGLDAPLNNVAWPNLPTSIAVFGGTAGSVTISTGVGVTANGLTFNSSGYFVSSSTAADVILLAGTTPTISVTNAGHTARINSILTGTAGLTIGGNGNVLLAGANTFTGQLVINSGILTAGSATALGATGVGNEVIVNAGGTLDVGGQVFGAKMIRIAGTGAGGIGALTNSGINLTAANDIQFLTLTANATVNAQGQYAPNLGSVAGTNYGRLEVRTAGYTAGAQNLNLAGNTLTKTGRGQFSLVNADVTTGNVVINDGIFGIEADTRFGVGSTITVNAPARLGFFNLAATAVIPTITVAGGSIGEVGNATAAQTLTSSVNLTTGPVELWANSANGPNFSGSISGTIASGVTQVAKRGAGTIVLSNQANTFDAPVAIYQATLQANYTTAVTGGIGAPEIAQGTPLGANPTVILSGGTLSVRVDGSNDTTTNNQISINKDILVDRAPSTINVDRLTATGGQNKNIVINSLTFAAPSAANGNSIGQNQLTMTQTNGFRLQVGPVTMNSDSVFNVGDFTYTGNITSAGGNSMVKVGGNSIGFIAGTHTFNAFFQLGASNTRVGSGFGTTVTNDTVTLGTGQIYTAPGSQITFRTPSNIAAGQTFEIVSQRVSQGLINFEQFTSVPDGLRALGSGVLGIGGATAFGDVDLSRIGDGTFFLGMASNLNAAATITGRILPGAGGVVRLTGANTGVLTISGEDRLSGGITLQVGSDLINGVIRTALAGNLSGTVVLAGTNNYTGGTVVNRGATLRFESGNPGTGPITAFGTASAAGAGGTFITSGGTNMSVSIQGGSNLRFDSSALTTATDVDRWLDSEPIALRSSTLQLDARNNNSITNETVGPISFSGGSFFSLQRNNIGGSQVTQLQAPTLTRIGQGTLEIARAGNSGFGGTIKILVTGTQPLITNGLISQYFILNDPTRLQNFATYNANGIINAAYTAIITTGAIPGTLDTGLLDTGYYYLDFNAANTTLTLGDNPIVYALKLGGGTANTTLSQSGANTTVTLRSGGLIFSGDVSAGNFSNDGARTVNFGPNLVANNGTANIEALINVRNQFTANLGAQVTALNLTKSGAGLLSIAASQADLTGAISINQGTLQLFGPTATAVHNPAGTGTILLNGGQLNLRSNNSAVTGVINPTLQNSVVVGENIPLAVIDSNRSAADTVSTGTFIFNPAVSGPGLQLLGSPGVQGQTLTISGANYAVQFAGNAVNSFAGNVTINNAITVTLNNAPSISGVSPVITKSGAGNLIVGSVLGTTAVPDNTQVHLNAGTLELRSITAFGNGGVGKTTLVLNGGTLNLRRDSAGNYGGAALTAYPVVINGNATISTDRVGGTGTNFAEGLGSLTLNGNPTVTFTAANGIYPEFFAIGGVAMRLNGLPILSSGVTPGGVETSVKVSGLVAGAGLIKTGTGHLHLVGANSTYDGGTFINQGILRARASNALGTGPVVLNPGATIDFNSTANLAFDQKLIIRGNSSFIPMVSMNTDNPHPTGPSVDATGASVGVVGLSNGTSGTYNTPIDLGALYGGGWSLGGISTGAYDARYTAETLGVGSGNLYRLGGGGLAFIFSLDTGSNARNNLLTGANNVRLGFESGNILNNNSTTFQFVISGTQDYSGGTTTIHRGTVGVLTAANNGTQSGFSNSSVDVFGNFVLRSQASLVVGGGLNTNSVVLHPGSALHLDNNNGSGNSAGVLAAANLADRFGDNVNLLLNGALLDYLGSTAGSTETIGNTTYARGSRIRVGRNTANATLTLNSLNAAGGTGHTLSLQVGTAGQLGISENIIVATNPPSPVNGMVSPSIVNQTENTFVTYGLTGFANASYDKQVNATYVAGNLLSTDKVDVITAALVLPDNPTVYALRTSQNINVAGPNSSVTIRSGGFIGTGGTIQPNLVFNNGTANINAQIYNSGTVTINGAIIANGITKFGVGNLTINVAQPQHTSGWTVNAGTLQINDLNGLGPSVPGNAIVLNATQTTGGSVAQALGQTNLTLNRDTGSPELAVFTGGPITVVNEATIRANGTTDRNFQIPNVTLMSTGSSSVGFTFDVPQNRSRVTIPTLTLSNSAVIRVLDSGSLNDTGRVTAGVIGSLVGDGVQLLKIGNRTLELGGDNSTTFVNSKIVVSQSGVRVLHNSALGGATSSATIERNATLEIGVANFASTATITQLPGSIERWNLENARAAAYVLPAGVNLQLNTNLSAARTIGLNGGTIEGFLWIDHPAAAVQRNVGSAVTINLLSNSFVGQNIIQGPFYDAGRQPTLSGPFGDTITGTVLRIDGNITGAFDLTKTGLDTVVLAGTGNTYQDTIVDMGLLRIGANNALPGSGTLTTRYAGTFDLNGFNQLVGGLGTGFLDPNPGAVGLGNSGRIVNSAPTINTLLVNNGGDFVYNGTIDQTVALTKSADGSLTLTAANTYVGNTTIVAGELILTGSINGSPVIDVQAGTTFDVSGAVGYSLRSHQTLKGTGTVVGSVDIDGTISPGAGLGALTLTGSADFDPGSSFSIELASPASFDQLVASNTTLDGTVNLSIALNYSPVASNTFIIVNNTSVLPVGGSSGLFTWGGPEGTLTEGELFLINGSEFRITYAFGPDANDIALIATIPEPTSLAALATGLAVLGLRRRRARQR